MALDTILAQSAPAAATLDNIYSVPTSFRDALYVVATNTSSTAATFRVAFVPTGQVLSRKHYQVYDTTVSVIPQATRRMALPAGTDIWVYSSTADVNFCVNGIEQDV